VTGLDLVARPTQDGPAAQFREPLGEAIADGARVLPAGRPADQTAGADRSAFSGASAFAGLDQIGCAKRGKSRRMVGGGEQAWRLAVVGPRVCVDRRRGPEPRGWGGPGTGGFGGTLHLGAPYKRNLKVPPVSGAPWGHLGQIAENVGVLSTFQKRWGHL
jgi:hypothetical protein